MFAAQLSLMSSLVDRHGFIVMKPGPTVELRWLNPSLFMLLNVGGTEKSWAELEQAELVYP